MASFIICFILFVTVIVEMETVKSVWSEVDSFFEKITPKCGTELVSWSLVEKCKEIEAKLKFPLRYVMMGITALIAIVFYVLTRKHGFFTYAAFFPSVIFFMKSISEEKGEEKKWTAFWFFFAFVEIVSKPFNNIIYYGVVKCVALLYLAIYDDCAILVESIQKIYEYANKGYSWYLNSVCACKEE